MKLKRRNHVPTYIPVRRTADAKHHYFICTPGPALGGLLAEQPAGHLSPLDAHIERDCRGAVRDTLRGAGGTLHVGHTCSASNLTNSLFTRIWFSYFKARKPQASSQWDWHLLKWKN